MKMWEENLPTFLLGAATGDTFNALVHFEKYLRGQNFSLVIRKSRESLVRTILGNYETLPETIYVWSEDEASFRRLVTADVPKFRRRPLLSRTLTPGKQILWSDVADWDYINPIESHTSDKWREY